MKKDNDFDNIFRSRPMFSLTVSVDAHTHKLTVGSDFDNVCHFLSVFPDSLANHGASIRLLRREEGLRLFHDGQAKAELEGIKASLGASVEKFKREVRKRKKKKLQ